jgi:hypothetical protein
MSLLPASGEMLSEFPSPRVILSFFPHPWPYRLGWPCQELNLPAASLSGSWAVLGPATTSRWQPCERGLSLTSEEVSCSWWNTEPGWLIRYSDGLQDGRPGLDSRQGKQIFLFSTASRPPAGPTQPLIQWAPRAVFPGVKWLGREADHSPTSSAEVKNGGVTRPLPDPSPLPDI